MRTKIAVIVFVIGLPVSNDAATSDHFSFGETVSPKYRACLEQGLLYSILFLEEREQFSLAEDMFQYFKLIGACKYAPLDDGEKQEAEARAAKKPINRLSKETIFGKLHYFFPLRPEPVNWVLHRR